MEKIKRTNPQAYHILKVFDECLAELGGHGSVSVTTTDDMPEEEKEMALFEGFLKEGYPVEEAEKKAREWLAMVKRISGRRRSRCGTGLK